MKKRADVLLAESGLAESLEKARALIMAGEVLWGTKRIDKAGQTLPADAVLSVKGKEHPWVSRGGLKLVKGLDFFGISPAGKTCMDVGCSTGGFTDVLLSRGAEKVYAIDVGYGQLAQKLRVDSRVVVLERTNARYLTAEQIPDPVDMIGAELIALIKPQFEAPKHLVGEGGIVRDPAVRREVCESVREWLDSTADWEVKGLTESPIRGQEGNVEFLIAAVKKS